MRVLHGYSGNLFGGIETMLVSLAQLKECYPQTKHEFALCFKGRLQQELEQAGAVVHSLGEVRFRQPWTVWRARRRLAHVLEVCPFDVVVCHACWPHALLAPVVRQAGIPLVFWAHDAIHKPTWVTRWASWTAPQLVIANSRYTAGTLTALFPQTRTELLAYPIPNTQLPHAETIRTQVRTEMQVPDDCTVLIQVSRMEAWKGHKLLLDALSLSNTTSAWQCWIVGGPQRAEEQRYQQALQRQVQAARLEERVRFLGQRSDVPRLLAAADVHCQPNLGPEPFGITFIEALYAGLPVVTTAMGGALEIVTPDCGLLVPPEDTIALAKKLTYLIDHPAECRRLGAAGPARAAALCNPQAIAPQLHSLLTSLVVA